MWQKYATGVSKAHEMFFLSGHKGAYVVVIIRFQIQHMQHYTQHDMQHSNPHTTHPQGLGVGWWWCGGGGALGDGGGGGG